MKRPWLSLLLLLGCIPNASADHITGGEVYYTFIGMSGGNYEYNVTVRLFMRCNSGRQFNNPTIVSVFDRSGGRIRDYSVPIDRIETLSLTHNDPCVTNPPTVCYEVGYYEFSIAVPPGDGYTLTAHVNFRIDGINNLTSFYDRVGATYIGEIPTSNNGYAENNSAHFSGEDLVVVCAGNFFSYSFAATDSDGDELRYSFCNAYNTSGGGGFGNNIEPPPPPPYQSVPYGDGYSGAEPLGNDVTIDEKTGLITGTAPPAGTYVITVCVEEIRNGVVIATQHKDLQVNIAPCSITAAALPDEYMLCDSTQTLTTKNLSTSPLIRSYNWEFLNAAGTVIFASDERTPTYTFADTGVYQIKLVINQQEQCSDSTMTTARVYPGFIPAFEVSNPCITKPVQFTDISTSRLGTINLWQWDFGENAVSNDFSELQHPNFSYTSIGNKQVTLITGNSLGCKDTISQLVDIYDKPPVNLAFRDTLICHPDQLQLKVEGDGKFSWTPLQEISDANSSGPIVTPRSTTRYYVELDRDGCTNRDSVLVRVVDHVSLDAMSNRVICEGDTLSLLVNSDGLKYTWTPAENLNDPAAKTPVSRTSSTTTYEVTASISGCIATDRITVATVPYPVVDAGSDTSICYNTPAQLLAATDGTSFTWTPAVLLDKPASLNPIAKPLTSTTFVFFAYDTKGCPKPGIDTVYVNVEPEMQGFAGRDTAVVINQPLQMGATGGVFYKWTPSTGLSADNVANPVALYKKTPAEGHYRYKVMMNNETGCTDSAFVQIRVFSSKPEIYVPTAFTPNGDGRNDFFQLVAAGIQSIQTFRVYNRWGQMVFDSPKTHSLGWDGSVGGRQQPTDTYVWMVKAVDYTGQPLFRKGTVTLIR